MDDDPNMLHGNNNETDKEKFTITLKTIQGDAEEFQVEKKMTIKEFGKKYIKEKGFSENTIMLFNFKGKKLDENKTFGDYNITPDDTIHILIRLHGGC